MKPFAYERPSSIEHALARGREPGSRFLAGGTELLNWLKIGIEAPTRLVDVSRLDLVGVEEDGSSIRVGAMTRLADLASDATIRTRLPGLSQAIELSASPQIRSMGTLAGNLLQRPRCPFFRMDLPAPCNLREAGSGCSARSGDPTYGAILGEMAECVAPHPSDPAVMLAALDAALEVRSSQGSRSLALNELFQAPSGLRPDELITQIVIPTTRLRTRYLKLRTRASFDFALVSAAVGLVVERGMVADLRIALGGVARRPWRLEWAEAELRGAAAVEAPIRSAIQAAVERALAPGLPPERRYKADLAIGIATRALLDLVGER